MEERKVKLFDSIEEGAKLIPEGEKRLVKVGDARLCLAHHEGQFIAFHNECPHQGYPLHEGAINFQNEIVCALHSYRFDLASGQESSDRCGGLRFCPVQEENDGVYLTL